MSCFLFGCETETVDQVTPLIRENIDIELLPGQPIVINLVEGVVTTEPVVISIIETPTIGDFHVLEELATKGIYETARNGTDHFSINYTVGESSFQRSFNLDISPNNIGSYKAIYDRGGFIDTGEAIEVEVLNNDQGEGNNLRIASGPRYGAATVTSDNMIAFRATNEFLGRIDIIYEADFNGESSSAIVRFVVRR